MPSTSVETNHDIQSHSVATLLATTSLCLKSPVACGGLVCASVARNAARTASRAACTVCRHASDTSASRGVRPSISDSNPSLRYSGIRRSAQLRRLAGSTFATARFNDSPFASAASCKNPLDHDRVSSGLLYPSLPRRLGHPRSDTDQLKLVGSYTARVAHSQIPASSVCGTRSTGVVEFASLCIRFPRRPKSLTEAERRQIIAVTTSPEFRDQSPKQLSTGRSRGTPA